MGILTCFFISSKFQNTTVVHFEKNTVVFVEINLLLDIYFGRMHIFIALSLFIQIMLSFLIFLHILFLLLLLLLMLFLILCLMTFHSFIHEAFIFVYKVILKFCIDFDTMNRIFFHHFSYSDIICKQDKNCFLYICFLPGNFSLFSSYLV